MVRIVHPACGIVKEEILADELCMNIALQRCRVCRVEHVFCGEYIQVREI
jgi:hypothetical protein